MTKAVTLSTTKLESNKLWQTASRVAVWAYGVLDEFPEDEKWGMEQTLRQAAFDATSDIAEALGALDPRDKKDHLGLARQSLFAVRNVCLMARQTGMLALDPDVMLDISAAVSLIDGEVERATKNIPLWLREFAREDEATDHE